MEVDRVDLRGIGAMERGQNKGPLYIQLSRTIMEQIRAGKSPVGALLPTEAQISEIFEVSRHTVRQAILHLRQQGLVSARKGIGTRIEALSPQRSYSQSTQTLSETVQFATATRLAVHELTKVDVRGQEASVLGCRQGREWSCVSGLRYDLEADAPL